MREIVKADYPMTGRRVTREEAIETLLATTRTRSRSRARSPRAIRSRCTPSASSPICAAAATRDSTGAIGALELESVAGAYWRGKSEQPDAAAHLRHGVRHAARARRLPRSSSKKRRSAITASSGAELDLYHVDELAGGGLIFWHPKGALMRGIVEQFIRDGLRERGYLPVVTPHVVHENLYATSGHLENFADSMFGPIEVEGQRFRLKPMNCPGHILIYKNDAHSYRDLPLRFSEFGTVYRFELSGTLHGLTRVRGFTQDDAHLFCTPEQLQGEFEQTLDEALRLMDAFGFSRVRVFPEHARGARPDRRRRRSRDPQRARVAEPAVRDRRRRRRVLRPQARHQPARRDRPQVAARHRAGRLRAARALRAQVPRPPTAWTTAR